jgi:hypothetical protein
VTGAATFDSTLIAGTLLRFTTGSPIAVTQDSIITPTNTLQPLSAAGACSTASIAALTAGTYVWFYNTSANVITITDTGTLLLSGNIALGQYDTLLLWCDGTNWMQLATSNN